MTRRILLLLLLLPLACQREVEVDHEGHTAFYVQLRHRVCGKIAYYAAHDGGVMPSCLRHPDHTAIAPGEMWECAYCRMWLDPVRDLYYDTVKA